MPGETRMTCTACATTLLLEFGLLSRLSGNPVYEQHAHNAARQVFGERLLPAAYMLITCFRKHLYA